MEKNSKTCIIKRRKSNLRININNEKTAGDNESKEEFKFSSQIDANQKFQKTMPKFANKINHGVHQQLPISNTMLNKCSQQQRKIPPKPPQRRYLPPSKVRHEPEGMQQQPIFTANFQEKKTFQLAIVQQTHKLAREPLKPPPQISTTVHFNQQNQHLLNQLPHQMQISSHFSQNNFLPQYHQNNNVMFRTHRHHNNNHSFNNFQQQRQHLQNQQQQMIFHSQLRQQQLVIAGMQMRMSAMRNRRYLPTRRYGSGSSGSDPENHIYEIIDEEEAQIQSQKFLPNKSQMPYKIESIDEENENGELFQNLLNAEMTNQIEICNKDNGYLSHLTHAKRMDIIQETAISIATAAYVEKAAQKMVSAANGTKPRSQTATSERGGYSGAIQRAPPPMPASLARRMSNKENLGFGRVKVMLRASDNPPVDGDKSSSMVIDKKKRQVTLYEPLPQPTNTMSQSTNATNLQDRAPMVSAPKMFAFDALYTNEDNQIDVCTSALSEVIPAVIDGSDGCLLALGYPGAGQQRTMLGSLTSPNDLGAIPCAISWLFKGINEKRQKSGARFSVRVSAQGISASKPGSSARDLLAALATESDESPGMYLRDDFLGGPTELRAPTAERAALFLDAALAGRTNSIYEPALIFTLHVYQYSLGAGKGGVAGGRSRLHLIDLGGCANRSGGLPLSGVGNVVLSILSGQKHPPNRDHPLTPLLKDCLAPLTCHVAIIAHVAHSQTHADSLTTIQIASRIHRLRRRKHRFPFTTEKSGGGGQSGSSSGADPTSSDFSADTVIYVGPSLDDATDNEHPPVFLPNLNSGDNRCAMNKVLRGSVVEKASTLTKSPVKKLSNAQKTQNSSHQQQQQQKSDSLKRNQTAKHIMNETSSTIQSPSDHTIYAQIAASSSPKIVAGALIHSSVSKASNFPTPKNSPLRKNPSLSNSNNSNNNNNSGSNNNQENSPTRKIEEKWIDGPRVSKYRVAEARHLMREINHVKKCETWIDGPNINPTQKVSTQNVSQTTHHSATNTNYGYMDSHKRKMIRQWVENQACQIFQQADATPVQYHTYYKSQSQQKIEIAPLNKNDDDRSSIASSTKEEFVNPISAGLTGLPTTSIIKCAESSIKTGLTQQNAEHDIDIRSERSFSNLSEIRQIGVGSACGGDGEEEDQDSGPSEVPPALPLIDPLSSREVSRHVSRESLAQSIVVMMDCALQVTEDDIARAMGEHPLSALSNGDISVVSSFNIGDTFSECIIGDSTRNQFDQLARLRELFNSQLAMAEVIPAFRIDTGSVYSEPAYRFNAGPGSVCSEPVYRDPSPGRCRDCRQSISRTPSQNSLPSLNGIVALAGMEPYASLRHPDGASDPNIKKSLENCDADEKIEIHIKENPLAEICETEMIDKKTSLLTQSKPPPQLPLLPISTPEAYDSGHDSTPRASKHSGISRRAESGYHSVATVRDSDESSFSSAASRHRQKNQEAKVEKLTSGGKKKNRQDKSLCQWLRNPFTCTYPETEGDASDF